MISMLNRNFTPFPILSSARLTLRQLTNNDAPGIFTLRSDHDINKYLDRPLSKTIDDARAFIERVNQNIIDNKALYWAITLNDTEAMAGTICLYGFSTEHHNCEIGFELLPHFHGQGIMQEAAGIVIEYAFRALGTEKLLAFVHRDNLRSIRLLEQLQFNPSHETDPDSPELKAYILKQ